MMFPPQDEYFYKPVVIWDWVLDSWVLKGWLRMDDPLDYLFIDTVDEDSPDYFFLTDTKVH